MYVNHESENEKQGKGNVICTAMWNGKRNMRKTKVKKYINGNENKKRNMWYGEREKNL